MRRATRVLAALACGISQTRAAQLALAWPGRACCQALMLLATPFLTRWCRPRAGQTAITNTNIWTAVEECQAESATFDCPASQATYGPIEDWDVGAVTSLNNHGNGCTRGESQFCGRASPILRLV